jgi:hypothetical protein
MHCDIARQKTNNNVIPAQAGIQSLRALLCFFGVVIKTVLDVTNVINLDHGFCLWIPAFAGMT